MYLYIFESGYHVAHTSLVFIDFCIEGWSWTSDPFTSSPPRPENAEIAGVLTTPILWDVEMEPRALFVQGRHYTNGVPSGALYDFNFLIETVSDLTLNF